MKTLFISTLIALATFITINVSGNYTTDFGALILKQNKNIVNGNYSYTYNNEKVNGTLTGTLTNNILNFTWSQIQGVGKSGGTGVFTFAKDGKSYKGTWEDSKGQAGTWNGKKN